MSDERKERLSEISYLIREFHSAEGRFVAVRTEQVNEYMDAADAALGILPVPVVWGEGNV